MKHACVIISTLLLLAVSIATSSNALELSDFRVNDDGGNDLQDHPRIAVAPDGSFAVVWTDRRGGVSDVYLQQYDALGSPVGRNVRITDDTDASFQKDPALAVDYAGSFGVVWKDYREAGYPFNPDVYFQRLDAELSPLGSNLNLTTEFPDTIRETPDVALAAWGKGVVVWSDYRNYNWDIYGQLIAPDGSPLGDNFMINDDVTAARQHAPRVSTSPEGWFVVTWFDDRFGDNDIFVQVYDSSGAKLGDNLRVYNPKSGTRQAFPDVTTDGAGHFTVVWVTWENGTYPANPDIYARKLTRELVPVTDAYQINKDGTLRAQRQPSISADRLGNVAILWADSTGVSSWDIVGQMIDVDGVVREESFTANTFADSMQVQPDVALDGKHRYITWVDNRRGNFDIYAAVKQYNSPQLVAQPGAARFTFREGEALPESQTVAIEHNGYNPIDYQLGAMPNWVSVTPSSGTTPASVTVSITDASKTAGSYAVDIPLIDLFRNDSSSVLAVSLTVLPPDTVTPTDSLFLEPVNVQPEENFIVPCWLTLNQSADSVNLQLEYDTAGMKIDSLIVDDSFAAAADVQSGWTTAGKLTIIALPSDSATTLPTGRTFMANLHATAKSAPGSFTIADTARACSLRVVGGERYRVEVTGGQVIVDQTTSIEVPGELTPESFVLEQNYPNPFNAGTIIRFTLPYRADVRLDIFNILGQVVFTAVDEPLSAGEHAVSWDGRLQSGQAAPSGIYFYRLSTGGRAEVRKMVLIK